MDNKQLDAALIAWGALKEAFPYDVCAYDTHDTGLIEAVLLAGVEALRKAQQVSVTTFKTPEIRFEDKPKRSDGEFICAVSQESHAHGFR